MKTKIVIAGTVPISNRRKSQNLYPNT